MSNIGQIKPNIVLLNEHGITGKNKVDIKNYTTFTRNRDNKQMGGVSISVDNELKKSSFRVKVGEGEDEFIIVKNESFSPPINIVSVYGEQESRAPKMKVYEAWNRLTDELFKIIARQESIIMIGDFNKHIGNDELGVTGNHDKISFGGHLVRDLLSSGEFELVNNSEKARGGPFTRFSPSEPNNTERKSCLDFAIVSSNLMRYVKELIIDSSNQFQISRVTAANGGLRLTHTDHYTLILKLKNIPVKGSQKCLNFRQKLGTRIVTKNSKNSLSRAAI